MNGINPNNLTAQKRISEIAEILARRAHALPGSEVQFFVGEQGKKFAGHSSATEGALPLVGEIH